MIQQQLIEYEHIPEYKVEYKGDKVLWVLTNEVAKIDKEGNWYNITINTNLFPWIEDSKVIFVDKSTAISINGECTLINNKRTEWQKQIAHNDSLSNGEKAILLLFLDLYCTENNKDLVIYKEPIKFVGTNNIINSRLTEDDTQDFIYN